MKMRAFALLLALLLPAGGALAEVYAGTTVAAATIAVAAESGGTVEAACAVGETVEAGAVLATLRTKKVYAAEDGTVARILAKAGAAVDGAVLELSPVSRYTVYCTVDDAYQSAASTLVRTGESLYLRCTANGTHRGAGRITSIDGDTYMVEATGGEFYVGEAVYLYRDADFTASQRVGAGTVVEAEAQCYEAQGQLIRLHVAEGEYVERGELLFEYAEGAQTELAAPVAGIVTAAASAGEALQAGQAALTIAPFDAIQVELRLDETAAAALAPNETVELIRADDASETAMAGTILSVSRAAQDGLYAVRIAPAAPIERLGLTVWVRTRE